MKKSELRQIIREEIQNALTEDWKSNLKKAVSKFFPKDPPDEMINRAAELVQKYPGNDNRVATILVKEFPEYKKQAKKVAWMAGFQAPGTPSSIKKWKVHPGKSYDPFDPFQPWP